MLYCTSLDRFGRSTTASSQLFQATRCGRQSRRKITVAVQRMLRELLGLLESWSALHAHDGAKNELQKADHKFAPRKTDRTGPKIPTSSAQINHENVSKFFVLYSSAFQISRLCLILQVATVLSICIFSAALLEKLKPYLIASGRESNRNKNRKTRREE